MSTQRVRIPHSRPAARPQQAVGFPFDAADGGGSMSINLTTVELIRDLVEADNLDVTSTSGNDTINLEH